MKLFRPLFGERKEKAKEWIIAAENEEEAFIKAKNYFDNASPFLKPYLVPHARNWSPLVSVEEIKDQGNGIFLI